MAQTMIAPVGRRRLLKSAFAALVVLIAARRADSAATGGARPSVEQILRQYAGEFGGSNKKRTDRGARSDGGV